MIFQRLTTQCCCCIDLRLGCVLIFITEIFFIFFGLCLGQYSKAKVFWMLGRLGYMMHLIGTSMLLVGVIYKLSYPLRFYLVTNIVHLILDTIYIVIWALKCECCFYEVCVSSFGIGLSIYFWPVVFLFRRRCVWEKSPYNYQ